LAPQQIKQTKVLPGDGTQGKIGLTANVLTYSQYIVLGDWQFSKMSNVLPATVMAPDCHECIFTGVLY